MNLSDQFVERLLYDFNAVSETNVVIDDFDKIFETSQSIKL